MHKVEKPSGLARSMVVDKLHITACCAWSISLSVCPWFITTLQLSKNYVNVATSHCCGGLDYRLKENSTGCLVKVDFLAINGGVKLLDYIIQMLKKNHLQIFLTSNFVSPLLRNSYPVNCVNCFQVFKFFAASFYSVTSSMVTVSMVFLKSRRQLGTDRHTRDVAMAIL